MKHQLPPLDRKETVWGILFLFIQLLVVPIMVTILCDIIGLPLTATMQQFLCFAFNFICAALIFHRYWMSTFRGIVNKGFSILLAALIHFLLYYAGTLLINVLILKLDPNFSNANDTAITAMATDAKLLIGFSVIFLVPPVEEVLYRGIVFGKLYSFSPFLAYITSIFVFALIHVIGYWGAVPPFRLFLCFLQYIPAGYCLARAYETSESLLPSILIHAFINFLGIISM